MDVNLMLISGSCIMDTQVYVYILQSVDGSYYTGCCDELAIVLAKYDKYNKLLSDNDISLPAKLVHQQEFKTEEEAREIANEIRRWSKKEKQFLINNDWSEISKLAKKFI
jgi:putative endonuclease